MGWRGVLERASTGDREQRKGLTTSDLNPSAPPAPVMNPYFLFGRLRLRRVPPPIGGTGAVHRVYELLDLHIEVAPQRANGIPGTIPTNGPTRPPGTPGDQEPRPRQPPNTSTGSTNCSTSRSP